MQANSATVQQAKKWFDLTRYRPAASLTLDDWIGQIAKRVSIEAAVKERASIEAAIKEQESIEAAIQAREKNLEKLTKKLQDVVAHLDALVGGLIREPLADWPFKYSNDARAVNDSNPATSSVVPLGFDDLDRLQILRHEIPPHGLQTIDEWTLSEKDLANVRSFGHLKIDLNAKDADILASFEHWLSACRPKPRHADPETRYRLELETKMRYWHQVKILPYFDLIAWSRWAKLRLTEPHILRLLFRDVREREALKPIKKTAEEVFTMPNVIALSMKPQA